MPHWRCCWTAFALQKWSHMPPHHPSSPLPPTPPSLTPHHLHYKGGKRLVLLSRSVPASISPLLATNLPPIPGNVAWKGVRTLRTRPRSTMDSPLSLSCSKTVLHRDWPRCRLVAGFWLNIKDARGSRNGMCCFFIFSPPHFDVRLLFHRWVQIIFCAIVSDYCITTVI